ncbi:MAG: phospho-N-acetylmuramoyl-pentapeptide-transferase [Cytophagales bacterium]|nr:phospho-N-acetylmuramoyl-pentapeptide-transferase [Cytophagales bacterium]
MLSYLFDYLNQLDISGTGVFQYISFRAGAAVVLSLLIAMFFGNKFIKFLQRKQMGESIRDLGLDGQMQKAGTPTMGGIIIIICILVPTLLFAKLDNIYIILLLTTTVWMGLIGFADDYLKIIKKNKDGLKGKFKVFGQIGLGLIVGTTLFFHEDVKVREYFQNEEKEVVIVGEQNRRVHKIEEFIDKSKDYKDVKLPVTTIPFWKNNEGNYEWLLSLFGDNAREWTFLIYIFVAIFIVTAVSNGANLTDGIDGLATGTSAIVGVTLMLLAYVSSHSVFADYLNIMYLPKTEEIVIFCSAFVGACIGFLWFNSYPARVFMGDTGSLTLGGIIAVVALSIRKEMMIPLVCAVFLVENLSVIIQTSWFKYTKKKYGEGRRVFKMSPIHHHFQKMEVHEAKIVTRFWIVQIMFAVLALATLKLR